MLSIRKLTVTGLVTLAVCSCGLLLGSAPPALAAGAPFESLSSFGSAGTGSGQFETPYGVAVEASTGDVFVADVGNKRVEKFNPAGTTVESEITGAGTPSPEFNQEPLGVAVDNSGGSYKDDVYVAVSDEPSGEFAVDRFKPKSGKPNEYEYECQFTGPERGCFKEPATEAPAGAKFAEGQGVAIDSSGNAYIAAGHGVYEFEADGASLAPSAGAPLHEFSLFTVGVAVSGNDVYVITLGSGFEFELVKLVVNPTTHAVEEEAVLDTEAARAVTVDPGGNVYVVNEEAAGKSHVAEYASTATAGATPVEEFGAGEIDGSHGLAYSAQGNGKMYITEAANNDVHIFERNVSTEPKPEITGCAATVETPVAERLSCMLTPNGEALAHFDYREGSAPFAESTPRTVTSAGVFEEEVQHLRPAIGYTFKLLAKNKAGREVGEEVSFTTAPAVEGVKPCAAASVEGESATLGGSTLETIGGVEAKWYFEYGLATALTTAEQTSTSFPALAEAPVAGLEPNAEYHCWLVASDEYGTTQGLEGTFKTKALPPLIAGAPASFLAAHAATLVARVDPRHSATTFHFEYGETEAYGQQTPAEAGGSGLTEAYVRQRIEGLAVRTVYHFRVVATNEQDMTTYGPDETFTTGAEGIPAVQTGAATGVTQTGASISGTVDPEGIQTSYAFEVGTDTGYSGAKIYGDAGHGEVAAPITVGLEDLAPGTTYHYRLSATNVDGTSYGQDMTFTTPGFLSPITQPLTAPLLATPAIAFPTGSQANTGKTEPKKLTRAQKLTKALKACKKNKSKSKRAACEKQAHKKYGPTTKKAKGKAK
jgi:hypothetical protein